MERKVDVGTKEVKSAAVPVSSLFGGGEYVKVKKTDWNKIVNVFHKAVLLLTGKLKEHLLAVQEQAEQRFDVLVEQMAVSESVTEQLKTTDQMLWVRKMNSIRERAEEVVREEIIYTL